MTFNQTGVEVENSFIEIEGLIRALKNAFIVLTAERGKFYPNKSFGSRLQTVKEPAAAYALAYAREALDGMDGVYALKAEPMGRVIQVTLLVNNEKGMVNITLNEKI